MAENMDQHIKNTLEEHYAGVIASLNVYKDAIETMVSSLFEKETIDGDEVRRIIGDFEKENNIESRLQVAKEGQEIKAATEEENIGAEDDSENESDKE
jgi:cell division protease FtsH